MNFDVDKGEGGTPIVTVSGELDVSNVEQLEIAVAPIIETQPERLVVDVGALGFADSSAITLWVRWAANVGEVELRNASPLLRRVLKLMGLETTLRLTP